MESFSSDLDLKVSQSTTHVYHESFQQLCHLATEHTTKAQHSVSPGTLRASWTAVDDNALQESSSSLLELCDKLQALCDTELHTCCADGEAYYDNDSDCGTSVVGCSDAMSLLSRQSSNRTSKDEDAVKCALSEEEAMTSSVTTPVKSSCGSLDVLSHALSTCDLTPCMTPRSPGQTGMSQCGSASDEGLASDDNIDSVAMPQGVNWADFVDEDDDDDFDSRFPDVGNDRDGDDDDDYDDDMSLGITRPATPGIFTSEMPDDFPDACGRRVSPRWLSARYVPLYCSIGLYEMHNIEEVDESAFLC